MGVYRCLCSWKNMQKYAAILSLIYGALAHTPQQLGQSETFDIINKAHDIIGSVKLTQGHEGILIGIEATGLPPGKHGLHIHEFGSCTGSSGFKSAGGHQGKHPQANDQTHACGYQDCNHGFINRYGPEEGNLPNLIVPASGDVHVEFYNHMVNLFDQNNEKPPLLAGDGSAIVIHQFPDDHNTQPIGGSGP